MFADKYLVKQNKKQLIPFPSQESTGIIVVIPCLNEPDVLQTLNSLLKCTLPKGTVEVIVLINHSEIAHNDVKNINSKTKQKIDDWIASNKASEICFYAVGPIELRKKWAGAGLARKQGMDEAVFRFNQIDKKDGLIVSLDADTLVEQNYFVEIERHFFSNLKNVGATISFEHQKAGLEKKHLQGIEYYENYLDYYKRALDFSGYPFSMFTIGSAFVVKAEAYIKRGGMNRRQAGEDFYFLQGLVQIGNIGEINATKVYPSSRLSNRVPFGTGPILQKWMNNREDLTVTYNFLAFADLKVFFDRKSKLYRLKQSGYLNNIEKLPDSIRDFLKQDNFWKELEDLNKNCSNLKSFNSRFFQKFNAFKILKYLNFVHENYYKKEKLTEQIRKLDHKFSNP